VSALAAPVVLPDDPFHGDDSSEEPSPELVRGDVDGDGMVSTVDYILVKRHYMNNFVLLGDQLAAADLDKDGSISTADYVIVKRIYMGTM
jgi:hypothetical protein